MSSGYFREEKTRQRSQSPSFISRALVQAALLKVSLSKALKLTRRAFL